jgi:hypothetical protein
VTVVVEEAVRRRLDAGDLDGAASAALRGYGPQVLGCLRAVLRDEDAAAEAFSRFAEALCKGLPRFRGEASLLTCVPIWLRPGTSGCTAVVDAAADVLDQGSGNTVIVE